MTTPAVNTNASAAGTQTTVQFNAGVPSPPTNVVAAASRSQTVRPASVNSPKRPDGTRAPRNWTSRGGTFIGPSGRLSVANTGTVIRVSTGRLMTAPPSLGSIAPATPVSDLHAYAVRRALGNFGEAEMQFGVALREVGSTCKLVTDYYRRSADVLGRVTQDVVNRPGFKRAMKQYVRGWRQAPSRYLEYLYGMKPLADEIANAVEVLTDSKEAKRGFGLRLRGKYKSYEAQEVQLNCVTFTVAKAQLALRCQSKASLKFNLPDWYWDELPPVTAFSELYETTSLSFVLDWVLPLGEWIRGFEGFQLRPFFQEGSSTVFLRRVGTRATIVPSAGWTPSANALGIQWREYYMNRIAFTSFPSYLIMRVPRLRLALSIDKMDDASALAAQRLMKLSRELLT